MPDISLVIPAYNEAAFLGRTLVAINEARAVYGDPSAIEVVVHSRCVGLDRGSFR